MSTIQSRWNHSRRAGNKNHQRPKRAAIAAVELALCLPLLVVAVFGTLETCHAIYMRQNLSIVAYEGARIGIVRGADKALVDYQCKLMLDSRKILDYQIDVSPDPASLSAGDLLTVQVSAGCDANITMSNFFYDSKTLTETVVIRAE